jgi:hypothetical protein
MPTRFIFPALRPKAVGALALCLCGVASVLVVQRPVPSFAAATAPSTSSKSLCASELPSVKRSERPQARAELMPPGAEYIRLCRYSGINTSPPQHLQRWTTLDARGTVGALARQFDALPRRTATSTCPADSGTAIVAFAEYRHGPSVMVGVDLTCDLISNGFVHRVAVGAYQKLIGTLECLTSRAHDALSHASDTGACIRGR